MSTVPDDEGLEAVLRSELNQLHARLAALPSTSFAERSPLLKRRDEVSEQLRQLVTADPELLAKWAEQAARKSRKPETQRPIPSPIEGPAG